MRFPDPRWSSITVRPHWSAAAGAFAGTRQGRSLSSAVRLRAGEIPPPRSSYSPVIDTYCTVPEASVTASLPVITSDEHHVTLIVQLAPAASVPQLFVCLNWPVMRTDLIDVLVLRGLVTVTFPPAQSNRINAGGESVTRAPLPRTDADFEPVPASENVTVPFRSPPVVG